jgi:hypothetical protein
MGDRVVLDEELDGQRCPPVQRVRRHPVELLVGQLADRRGRRPDVLAHQRDRRRLVGLGMLAGVLQVDPVHRLPVQVRHPSLSGEGGHHVGFEGVHRAHVVDQHAHRAVLGVTGGAPLLLGQGLHGGNQVLGPLLDTAGQFLGAGAH